MKLLRPRTIPEIIEAELADARRAMLEAQTAADYANAMVLYQQNRIKRLEAQQARGLETQQ
jgi:hypothetical protein